VRTLCMRCLATMAVLSLAPAMMAQTGATAPRAASQKQGFDPHNLNGSWIGVKRFFGDDNTVPEPPLTQWGREHLLLKNISHPGLSNNIYAGGRGSGAKVDPNGVPADVGGGHYPGEGCAPEGAPVQFNYTGAYPFMFIMLPDRIYQMFENHREWRVFWLNRDHPKDLTPSYMGDSVAKWEGNTLVVDTIGFNGKDWFSENVGQLMSDQFHLVERYHLTDATHLTLEMTYYDPKAWGDKPWPGWKKEFNLDSRSDTLEESMCDPSHWQQYDGEISNPVDSKQ
jgi:hypothetical protein